MKRFENSFKRTNFVKTHPKLNVTAIRVCDIGFSKSAKAITNINSYGPANTYLSYWLCIIRVH